MSGMHARHLHLPARLRWILYCVLPLLVSCGFHLRGQDTPSLSGYVLSLQCSQGTHWHLCQSLRRELELSGIALNDDAPLLLQVDNAKTEQRTLALEPNSDAAEYLVSMRVDVVLRQKHDDTTLAEAQLNASHTLRSRDTAAMKQSAESNAIHSAIQTQLARDIVNWLSFQLPRQASGPANET